MTTTEPQTSGAERRVHERYEVIAQVEVNASDDVLLLALKNISLGGALLQVPDAAQFSTGDELSAFVDLSDDAGDNLAVNLEAEVIRSIHEPGSEAAIAVRWIGESDFSRKQLERVIEFVARTSRAI